MFAVRHFAHGNIAYTSQLNLSEPPIAFVTATREIPKIAVDRPRIQVASNSANVILGQQIALDQGIYGQEWECLYQVGMRESGWNHLAKNKVSGAFGIPQSLPASKLDTFGNRFDPAVQIRWMIDYIENRYSTSCNALQFSLKNNWY